MNDMRKVWFITRPERDPSFHQEALIALQRTTNNFSLRWKGNRVLHKKYEEMLAEAHIKRDHVSHDGSGGRTWVALLKTFSYVYPDADGYLLLTKVGKKILEGEKVFENIRKQILTLQIPNAYFLESGFQPKFDSDFHIRPVRFLIRLANQKELAYYVTKEEITFFALTAKTDNQLGEFTERILRFRQSEPKQQDNQKQAIAMQYEHRSRSDKAARDFAMAHGDVAHTLMLISAYTGLVEYARKSVIRVPPSQSMETDATIRYFDERYPFNSRYLISLERMAENNGLDIDSYKASSYHTSKPASNRHKMTAKADRILAARFPSLSHVPEQDIVAALGQEMPPYEAQRVAQDIARNREQYAALNLDFVEKYLAEEDNRAFEEKTGHVFKELGFDVVMNPRPQQMQTNTEIEILLKYGQVACGIIDAKNYRDKFALSASLASHMGAEYIPNYDGYEGRTLQFFGYVTAHGWGGAGNLSKISGIARRAIPHREIPGIMITAQALLGFLDYCIENDLLPAERIRQFVQAVQNQGYRTVSELLRTVTAG